MPSSSSSYNRLYVAVAAVPPIHPNLPRAFLRPPHPETAGEPVINYFIVEDSSFSIELPGARGSRG
uniref:Uncharacterized protein n=1 Tax=Triticum urartu TaxID=4572 RepID=A0A8R7JZ78_TRIUA